MKLLKIIIIILIFNIFLFGCNNYVENDIKQNDDFVLELNEPLTKNIKYGAHSNIEDTEEFKTINYSPKYIHSLPCNTTTNDCINLATPLKEKDYNYEFNIPKNWIIKDNMIYSDEFDSQWMISISPVIHKSDKLFILDEKIINFTKLGDFKELLISNTYSHNRFMLGKETLIGVSFRDYEIFINCDNYIIKFIAYINPKDEKYLFNFIDTFKLYFKNTEIKTDY